MLLAACDNATTSGNQTTSGPVSVSDSFNVRVVIETEGCRSFTWRAVASDSGRRPARRVTFRLTDPEFADSYVGDFADGDFNGYVRTISWDYPTPGTHRIFWSFESGEYIARDSLTIC